MDDALKDRLEKASEACDTTVFWHPKRTPAEVLRAVADAADELGVDEWDVYAEKGAVQRLEAQVAELLGKPAAALFPSGIMAQQARPAGLVRPDRGRSGSRSPTCPTCSGTRTTVRAGCTASSSTTSRRAPDRDGRRPPSALTGGLGAALIELPLRDGGCMLPSWDDLTALSDAARELGVPLHADGARIWESQPYWGKALAEIAGLVDSMYVSFYKGLEGLAGAALVGPEDVVERGPHLAPPHGRHPVPPHAVRRRRPWSV